MSRSRVESWDFVIGTRNFLTEQILLASILLERSTKCYENPSDLHHPGRISLVSAHFAVAQIDASAVQHEPPQQFVIEVEVPAPVGEVWRVFTTSDGLSTWLTPNASVICGRGRMDCRFPGGSTGGGTIVSFVPEKELVLSAMAPNQFPHVRAERTRAVFSLSRRGNSTVVRLTQSGWKSGAEWTSAYGYLVAGNAQLMATLHERFVDGPIDWKKVFGESAARANDIAQSEGDKKMNLHTLNIWAVVAAAVSAFLIGGLWYSPVLLGAAWKRANGFTADPPAAGPKGFAIAFVLSLVMAINLAMFLNAPGTTLALGATAGFLAGFGMGSHGDGHHRGVRAPTVKLRADERRVSDGGVDRDGSDSGRVEIEDTPLELVRSR